MADARFQRLCEIAADARDQRERDAVAQLRAGLERFGCRPGSVFVAAPGADQTATPVLDVLHLLALDRRIEAVETPEAL